MAEQGVADGLKWKRFYNGFVGAVLNNNSPATKFCVLGVNLDSKQEDQKLAAC